MKSMKEMIQEWDIKEILNEGADLNEPVKMAKKSLSKLVSDKFEIVKLRPSTVYGYSPRLRCDIVFNNLLASGYTTGNISIKSDGSPWRPAIHVKDLCSAITACIDAPSALINNKVLY